jgi:molybdenum cofactor cytidylyltransferase
MIAAEDAILVLLAAGRSTRFGSENKLRQNFLGKPLGLHVATALEAIPFHERIAVTDGSDLDYGSRFRIVHNDAPERGLASSLRLGIADAKESGARAVAIALADMPRVTAAHVYRLLDAAEGDDAVVVSSDGVHPMPPGVFGRGRFDFLLNLEGDQGARDLIRAGCHVVASPAELIDVDTPDDLERLWAMVTRDVTHRSG